MLVTHITLDGTAAVSADFTRDLDSGRDVVRLYVGACLVLSMSPEMADALGDALADADTALQTPRWPQMDLPT